MKTTTMMLVARTLADGQAVTAAHIAAAFDRLLPADI